jgi:PAS domain S-box-containing protein
MSTEPSSPPPPWREPGAAPSLFASRSARIALVAVFLGAAVLVALLSAATDNTSIFAQGLRGVLAAGAVMVVVLVLITGRQLVIVRRRLRQRMFGSRLTLRLTALFTVVAVLPGVLVYAVSVQFLSRSIDGWFDVRVEKALDGGLALGQDVLATLLTDLRTRADTIATTLAEASPARQRATAGALRDAYGVDELALFDANGQPVAFSLDAAFGSAPELPAAQVLREVRMQKRHSAITSSADGGLLLRVAVPVNAEGGVLQVLQVTQRVPESVAHNAEAVRAAHADYQEIAVSRVGLKRLYGLTLTLALLLALLSAVLLALTFSQALAAPLGALAEGTRAVAQGDYSRRMQVRSYDELGVLTQSFNAMTRELDTARRDTQRSQAALEAAKASLESILANLSAGVIALDATGRLVAANPGAQRILGVALAPLVGVPVDRWAEQATALVALAGPLTEALAAPLEREWQREIAYPGAQGDALTLLVHVSRIVGAPDEGFVVVFDDLTRLLRAQRQAAWGEVARRLAHEIKNPLTPIQLSAERLQTRLHAKLDPAEADLLTRLTSTIVTQVGALNAMVDAFSEYARAPETRLEPLHLAPLVRDVLALYDAHGARLRTQLDDASPPVRGDAAGLRQVIHNLVRNAEDAVANVTLARIVVSVEPAGDAVALRVADNGAGFPREILARAREPYVTTKPRGTGLGLAIVQKIVEEHGGVLHLENLADGGARVSVLLPARSDPVAGPMRATVVARGAVA